MLSFLCRANDIAHSEKHSIHSGRRVPQVPAKPIDVLSVAVDKGGSNRAMRLPGSALAILAQLNKGEFRMSIRLAAGIGAVLFASAAAAQSLGSTITYQGQLTEAGLPALGLYDLQICLFDAPTAGTELACAPNLDDVPVEDGAFTVALDFGAGAFVGQQRWIELRIRPGADTGGYTILAPRQLVRPTPEALRAETADAATTADTATSADTATTADSAATAASAPWSGLTGVPAGFADGIDDDSGGTVTEITAGTGLEGGPITTTGTIGIADGGVGSTQIAPGAVGAAQIEPTEVQARVFGTCEPGFYVRGINADGSVICTPLVNQIRLQSLIVPGIAQGQFPSIAIGSDANPVISFWNYSQGRLQVRHCSSPTCSGSVANNVVDATASVGPYTSLAIGTDGFPVISYQDSTNLALKVAKCTDVACADPAILTTIDEDPTNNVGYWTSIAIGDDGLPIVAYQDGTAGTLKVAKCTTADCTGNATITVVDPDAVNVVGSYTSIAIGNDGLPVVSYHDVTAQALKVAKCTNADCTGAATLTTIDSDGSAPSEFGAYSSIAIGNDGLPIISYWDTILLALKVAKCTDAACAQPAMLHVVDDPIDGTSVGAWTSLEIAPDGRPSISYHDVTRRDPKFVRCADPACAGPGNEIISLPSGDIFEGEMTSLALWDGTAPIFAYWSRQEGILRLVVCGTSNCQ